MADGANNGNGKNPPEQQARRAGLRYVNDSMPGIRRRRCGRGFTYLDPDGETIRDPEERRRIEELAIPPAWTDVWICPRANGHLQATGYDDKGRKQYRYHPRWREVRDATKFSRMLHFGECLPRLRSRVGRDLSRPEPTREKVAAAAVRLLDTCFLRVGSRRYTKENGSYGLTTLRRKHVEVKGSTLRLSFRGKGGQERELAISDRRLARLLRRSMDLPGYELFRYLDEDDSCQTLDAEDVNEYLQEATGHDFTAKDFRTWAGSALAAEALYEMGEPASEAEAKKNIVSAVKEAAAELGNRPATCRQFYVHPEVLEAYAAGELLPHLERGLGETMPGLRREERALMAFLRRSAMPLAA